MKCGINYIGSKQYIAPDIASFLIKENKRTLVELFCGGCSITDYCVANNLFDNYIVNDRTEIGLIYKQLTESTDKEIFDKYSRIITREEFDTAPKLFKMMWSYQNLEKSYIYSRKLEKYMLKLIDHIYNNTPFLNLPIGDNFIETYHLCDRELRRRIVNREMDDLLVELGKTNYIEKLNKGDLRSKNYTFITEPKPVQFLIKLLKLRRTDKITAYQRDYKDVPIPDAVIYLDPPYKNTRGYFFDVDDGFYNYCVELSKKHPVYVSEIEINHPNFHLVWEKTIRNCAVNYMKKRTERLYKVC